MAASASSVWYNLRVRHPTREVPIIDYNLALLFQPMLMLGITVGVALSVVFPYWLITVLIIILFLGNIKSIVFWYQETGWFVLQFLVVMDESDGLSGTSSRSFYKGTLMWKEETFVKVRFNITSIQRIFLSSLQLRSSWAKGIYCSKNWRVRKQLRSTLEMNVSADDP